MNQTKRNANYASSAIGLTKCISETVCKCDSYPFRRICSGPWKSPQIRVLHIGRQPCPWKPIFFFFPKGTTLGMPWCLRYGWTQPHFHVQIEPTLVPLSGSGLPFYRSANVSSVRKARCQVPLAFWWRPTSVGRCSTSAFVAANAPSVRMVPVASQYVKHEKAIRRQYEQLCAKRRRNFSLYLLYSARQEEWVAPQPSHSSDCQRCLPRKLAWITQPQSMSFAKVRRSPCFAKQSLLYVAHERRLPHANSAARTRLCWIEAGLLENSPH